MRLPDDEVNGTGKMYVVLRTELLDKRVLQELACDFAERAQIYVANFRPDCVKAIETKRKWLRGEATNEELRTARYAAYAAAANAYAAACRTATADVAAADAERRWQVNHVIDVLEGMEHETDRCRRA